MHVIACVRILLFKLWLSCVSMPATADTLSILLLGWWLEFSCLVSFSLMHTVFLLAHTERTEALGQSILVHPQKTYTCLNPSRYIIVASALHLQLLPGES